MNYEYNKTSGTITRDKNKYFPRLFTGQIDAECPVKLLSSSNLQAHPQKYAQGNVRSTAALSAENVAARCHE